MLLINGFLHRRSENCFLVLFRSVFAKGDGKGSLGDFLRIFRACRQYIYLSILIKMKKCLFVCMWV